jgi:amino acid transporter
LSTGGAEVFVRKATGVVREVSSHEALLANIALLQIGLPGFYVYVTSWLFPGWDIPTVFLISLIPVTAHAIVISIMTSQFPRSGADYAWASRIVHPVWVVAPYVAYFVLATLLTPGFLDWGLYGGIGTIVESLSIILNRPDLLSGAASTIDPNVRFVLVSAFLVLFLVLNIARFSWVRKWISFWAIVGTVSGLVAGISLIMSSHETFVSLWNLHMGQYMTYDQVIQTASSNGYPWVAAGAGTFGAFFAILANTYEMSIGYQGSISFSGEIKNARRSIPYATLGCVYLGALVLFLMVYGITHVVGQQFVYSALYLYYARPELWKGPFVADPFLFATIATGLNPILAVVIPLGLISGALGLIAISYIVFSRYLLAFSFDRFMPTAMARVSKRYHTPWLALLVIFLISECGIAFSAYWAPGVIFIGLPFRSMSMLSIVATVGAALLFPLLARPLYQRSDIVQRYKYVLALCCVIVLAFFVLAVPMVLSHPEYGGPSNPQIAAFYISLLFIGPVIWGLSKLYWKRRGLDIALAYKEIPPQ